MLLISNGHCLPGSRCFQVITSFKSFKCLYLKENFTIGEITKQILGKIVPIFFEE